MHITIDNASQFRDQFHRAGRGDQFSYEALGLLFDYFEEIESAMELDVVAICCDFSEADIETIANDYSVSIAGLTSRGKKEAVCDFLENNTSVVCETSTGAIVYANF